MSSPFSIFRKHQRVLIAAAGLMAMIAFVFLPSLMRSPEGRGAAANPVMAVSKKYGQLTRRDVGYLIDQRRVARQFLHQLLLAPGFLGQEYASSPMIQNLFSAQVSRWVDRQLDNPTETSVVDTWLMARRAEEMGIAVTDRSVTDFLEEQWTAFMGMFSRQGAPPLDPDHVVKVLESQHLRESQLIRALHDEVLSRRLRVLFSGSAQLTPPEERWEYFQRAKRNASIELAALPVERFLGKVPDPDDATLQKFFDEHKSHFQDPDSPEPGFRQPRQIALEYFKADYEKFLDLKGVSDEQILAYYEQNKDKLYLKTTLPSRDAAAKKEPEAAKPANATPPASAPAAKKEAAPAKDSGAKKPDAAPAPKTPLGKEKVETKYTPLVEVKEQIRRILAESQASAKIPAALKPLREKMDVYSRAMIRYSVNVKTDEHTVRPVQPDLKSAAEKSGLQVVQLERLTAADAAKRDFAAAIVESTSEPMAATAFRSHVNQSDIAIDAASHNEYLFWKLDEQEERIPKFSDSHVRAEVLHAWKMAEAVELVRAEAKRLVEKVQKSKGTLKEALKGEAAVAGISEPKPFAWLTGVDQQQRMTQFPQMEVEGVEYPGDDFMQTVFGLKEGACGAAMNNPRTCAYLIQAIKFTPAPNLLWDAFMNANFREYDAAMLRETFHTNHAWLEDIKTQAGFHWEHAPDRPDANRNAGQAPAPADSEPMDDSDG